MFISFIYFLCFFLADAATFRVGRRAGVGLGIKVEMGVWSSERWGGCSEEQI